MRYNEKNKSKYTCNKGKRRNYQVNAKEIIFNKIIEENFPNLKKRFLSMY